MIKSKKRIGFGHKKNETLTSLAGISSQAQAQAKMTTATLENLKFPNENEFKKRLNMLRVG
jgi:hypothetical protein